MKYDLVLLHAPSVYDFRKNSLLAGPISDVVPSSPVFEMYPKRRQQFQLDTEQRKMKY
jgi:hypothetical protein